MRLHIHSADGRLRAAVVYAAATAVYVSLFRLAPTGASPVVFLFDFAYLVLLPGYLISAALLRRRGPVFTALASMTFGTGLFFLLLMCTVFLPIGITAARWIVPVLTGCLLLLRPNTGGAGRRFAGAAGRNGTLSSIVLLILLAACAFLVLYVGDPLLYTGDSQDHIAYIRSVARSGEAFPDTFLYADGGLLTRDIRKGLLHAMWGTLNAVRGNRDIAAVWDHIALITMIWTILAVFFAGSLLPGGSLTGLIAAFLFVLHYHRGLCGYQLITTAYGYPSGKIFYLVFLCLFLFGDERPSRGAYVLAAAAAFCAVATHVAHALLIGFLVALAGVCRIAGTAFGREDARHLRRWAVMTAWTAVAAAPYLLFRYIRDYHPNNVIHQHVQGILRLGRGLTTTNPVVFFDSAGELFVLAAVAVFFLWRFSRGHAPLRTLLWGIIAILVLMFNPLTVPLVLGALSYLLFRLEFAVPSMLVVACFIAYLSRGRLTDGPAGRRTAVAGWIIVALLLVPRLALTPAGFAYGGRVRAEAERRSCLNISDLYGAVQRDVPPGGTVVSDPITSYCIPAFTDRFVACTYDQHSIPNDSTAVERILACREVFSAKAPLSRVCAILDSCGSEYVAVNARLPAGIQALYWKPDRDEAVRAAERFRSATGIFETAWAAEGAWLMRYLGGGCPDSTAAPGTTAGLFRRSSPSDLRIPSDIDGIVIAGFEAGADTVSPGQRLDLTIDWKRTGKTPPGSYVTYIRFDAPFPGGALYSEAYGKPYRKIAELIGGRRYRFRHTRLPLGGLYAPDTWPLGTVVRDEFDVRVPEDIVDGDYTISVKMVKATKYPNYSLGDFLRDEDFYSGNPVGTICIRRSGIEPRRSGPDTAQRR